MSGGNLPRGPVVAIARTACAPAEAADGKARHIEMVEAFAQRRRWRKAKVAKIRRQAQEFCVSIGQEDRVREGADLGRCAAETPQESVVQPRAKPGRATVVVVPDRGWDVVKRISDFTAQLQLLEVQWDTEIAHHREGTMKDRQKPHRRRGRGMSRRTVHVASYRQSSHVRLPGHSVNAIRSEVTESGPSRQRGAMVLLVERLGPGSGVRWRTIRLQALQEAPYAFGTTVAEASSWPAAHWERQVEDVATFVAVAHGEDVGVVRGIPHPDLPRVREVIGMWVAPAARRRHVGGTLIGALTEWAGSEGADTLVLDVVEENAGAIAFYTRLGFELFEGDAFGVRAPGERRMVKAIPTVERHTTG